MVRTVNKKYQVWLAGYYDDFNGARAIPDDTNSPGSTRAHGNSHHGNPMNGEATLNPRYRWAEPDRDQTGSNLYASSSNKLLQNDGVFEFISHDDTRQSNNEWEGRAQLQYPDGHVANRYRFAGSGSLGYQRFVNGYDTLGSYLVPTGSNDATFGRAAMNGYTSGLFEDGTGSQSNAGVTDTSGDFVQRAHLAGVWMGEQFQETSSNTPHTLFAEVTSPAKKPFLVIQSSRWDRDDSADTPTLIYDGPLNTRLDGDVFTTRLCVRTMRGTGTSNWNRVDINFEIGFAKPTTALTDTGFTDAAAINFDIPLNDTTHTGTPLYIEYDQIGELYNNLGQEQSYTNDDTWLDIDFVMDYSAGEYDVYVNGTRVAENESMVGSPTAANLYGYQITIKNDTTLQQAGYVSYLMLDRAGVVRYLTDNLAGDSDDAPITGLQMKRTTNGMSDCRVTLSDIPDLHSDSIRGSVAANYNHNLKDLFVATSALDWQLLVFGDTSGRIDRPIWRGIIEKFDIKQKGRDRVLTFDARDALSIMERSVPLWEVGQEALNDSEVDTPYWLYEAKGFKDVMNFGTRKLKLLSNDIGFDKDSGHIETSTQRTQLGSGHPIQMYNNEDTAYGPNDLEDFYEGLGVTCVYKNASGHTTMELTRNPGSLSTGLGFINFTKSSHNTTGRTVSTQSADGKTLTFDGSTSAETITFTAETAKIIYMGKAWGPFYDYYLYTNIPPYKNQWSDIDAAHPNSTDFAAFGNAADLHFIFDSDPGLVVGDTFAVNGQNDAGATTVPTAYIGKHQVKQIKTTKSYFAASNDAQIWWVKTHTPYVVTNGGELGDYPNDSLLSGTARVSWSNDKGNIDTVTELPYRVLHSRWMRDLPKSLWFQYHFGKTEFAPVNLAVHGLVTNSQSITSATTSIQIPQLTYDNIPQYGVAEIWDFVGFKFTMKGKFVYQGKATSGGNYYLIGCKFTPTYTTTATTFLRVQSISSDYKHIWLLWSDMRNNGKADADGSFRKNEFGLQYPINDNYDVDMFYVDQLDADGNTDKFVSLKVGEDIDIWDVDATTDPITNGAFSKPADYSAPQTVSSIANDSGKLKILTSETGTVAAGDYIHLVGTADHDGIHKVASLSNDTHFITETTFVSTTLNTGGAVYYPTTGSDQDLTQYQDWEDKAGAFLVIDSSPFFNLNTNRNNSKTGQFSGGTTNLVDYVATREGQPTLIDNYWTEATPSELTTGDKGLFHPNAPWIVSEATLVEDLDNTQTYLNTNYLGLPVEDATVFTENGYGQIRAVISRSQNEQNINDFFFSWTGKIENELGSHTISSVETATSFEGIISTEITVSSGTPAFFANGVREGMVLVRTDAGDSSEHIHNIINVGDATDQDTDTKLIVQGDNIAVNDTFVIPVQVGKIFMTTLTDEEQNLALASRTGFADAIQEKYNALFCNTNSLTLWDIYGLKAGSETPKFVEVHPTIGSAFMLRLMMHLDGYVKARNSGTFYDSDKIRTLWNAALTDSWLPQTRLTAVYDINNVPNTTIMTTYNDTSSNDSYGSIVSTQGKTLTSILKAMRDKSGFGDTNGIKTTFSYMIGRDGRLEFRPKYDSQLAFTRQNMRVSNFSSTMISQITNVRVYYNGGASFVDYPKPSTTDTTRWKVIEQPDVASSEEATFLAKQEYNKNKVVPMSLIIEPIMHLDASNSQYDNKMIDGGRYGYIADPYIALKGLNANTDAERKYVTNWTRLGSGGVLFPGMVNALDGNQATTTDIYARYGSSAVDNTDASITYTENYTWYGANSISYALQVVDVTSNLPYVGATSGQPLRIYIDLKNQTGTSIDDAEFTIFLYDYSFANNVRTPTQLGVASINVKHSGFYEISVPTTYDGSAGGKIIVSFNAEYCRALLRHRCGDPSQTDHTASNYILDSSRNNGSGSVNANSIFPLGAREYDFQGGTMDDRMEWYGPRVLICNDMMYHPATIVSVTDPGVGLNTATDMVIKNISWGVKAGQTDSVVLELERDESFRPGSLSTFLFSRPGLVLSGGRSRRQTRLPSPQPPSNTPSTDTTPTLVGGGTKDTQSGYGETSISVGQLSHGSFGRQTQRMQLNNNSNLAILGQNNTPSTESVMVGIEGMDVSITPTSGSSVLSAEGFVLGGKGRAGDGDGNMSSQEVSIETQFTAPADVVDDRIIVTAKVSCGANSALSRKTAVLITTATVKDTGQSVTHTTNISTNTLQQTVDLIPLSKLTGVSTPKSRIDVKVVRKPGTGNDDADTSSVILHSLDVRLNRAASAAKSDSSQFSTFS
tara:strand:- start:336 stop:7148 length:6813 start_codon:yes stop_codon:yes gene_type:complete